MSQEKDEERERKEKNIPTISSILEDGTIVESVYHHLTNKTNFVLGRIGRDNRRWSPDEEWVYIPHVITESGRLVPYSPDNNLIKHKVVLLPSGPEEYGSEEELVAAIQSFIHKYAEVSSLFEKIASYYVLLSWVHDGFNELPYLRIRGEPGSGKTRFLTTIGSICYKPIFASGASTISPIFRLIDAIQGTLIIDESDFRVSDEKAEMVKILNNGNMKGFPVFRSEVTQKKEYEPRSYQVFGPKIVATRGFFDDPALESRCLSEDMGQKRIRRDIPLTLPESFAKETLILRNKLLLFRFRNLNCKKTNPNLVDWSIEPRLNQIFLPILSIINDQQTRNDLQELARSYNRQIISDRGMNAEAQALEIIRDLLAAKEDASLSIKEITASFQEHYGSDYERPITPKWIGNIIRKKLRFSPYKSEGVYFIRCLDKEKLGQLYERYGLAAKEDQQQEIS